MSKLKPNFYKLTGLSKTNTYIETGTYYGINLQEVMNEYKQIFSIEIEKKWVEYNKEKFENKNNIQIVEGDSSVKLPELCTQIEEGVTFFLDAHYSGEGTGYKEKTSPIIKELESIFHRKNNKDIVVIDDSRLFGKISIEGSDDHPYYKKAVLDWTSITLESIKKTIPKDWKILYNYNNSLSFGPVDQLIVCNVSSLIMIFIKIYQFFVFIINTSRNLIKTKQTNLRKMIKHLIKILLTDKAYKKIKDFLNYEKNI